VTAEKNLLVLTFDTKTLTIRVNDKRIVAYPRHELAHSVLEVIFENLELLINKPDDKVWFEHALLMLQIPSCGPCTICSRHANLLGGLCYTCLHDENQEG
jgi:hypothetical protein